MKALFIIVLCLLNTLLEAQNICLKGRLVDEHKNAVDRKSTRLNSSHIEESRMPSSA